MSPKYNLSEVRATRVVQRVIALLSPYPKWGGFKYISSSRARTDPAPEALFFIVLLFSIQGNRQSPQFKRFNTGRLDFCRMTSCSLVQAYTCQCFKGVCCLNLHKSFQERQSALGNVLNEDRINNWSSRPLTLLGLPWRRRQLSLAIRWFLYTTSTAP